jgi:MFS family permease
VIADVPSGAAHRRGPSVERGLDLLNLFVAGVQGGFGPFVAVYLTTQGWTQTAIGFALSIGTVTAMASQVPAGALVDAVRRKSRVAAFSILAFSLSALVFAIRPSPLFIYLVEMLHGISSCTLGPAIVAISLTVAGRAALGYRLGRNARYASIGNGLGAVLMGACGYYLTSRSVFFLAAALTLPALLALLPLARLDRDPCVAEGRRLERKVGVLQVLTDRRLLIFAASAMLFTLGNAAMLPLASTTLTRRAGDAASLLIAACIVLPQLIVALCSPEFGRIAETRGRRGILLLGFAVLPVRGLLFAVVADPAGIVMIQALDGIAAASFGIMIPLITSDLAGRTGHFNLSLGFVGFAIGLGATVSTTLAGWIADHLGDPAAFASLAVIGVAATALIGSAMPETGPQSRRLRRS